MLFPCFSNLFFSRSFIFFLSVSRYRNWDPMGKIPNQPTPFPQPLPKPFSSTSGPSVYSNHKSNSCRKNIHNSSWRLPPPHPIPLSSLFFIKKKKKKNKKCKFIFLLTLLFLTCTKWQADVKKMFRRDEKKVRVKTPVLRNMLMFFQSLGNHGEGVTEFLSGLISLGLLGRYSIKLELPFISIHIERDQ